MGNTVRVRLALLLNRLLRAIEADTESPSADPVLTPLVPSYNAEQHGTYVRHIENALDDPRVLNIALTGRYGTGKSSVLDEVEHKHKRHTLRVALSNLGTSDTNETLVNRVEKEFVKQLLHREPPRRLPRSRYRRIATRSWAGALLTTVFELGVVGALIWALAIPVPLRTLPPRTSAPVELVPWFVLGLCAVAIVTWAKLTIGDRVVSQLGAAGASVTIKKEEETYFDKFLDEIVYFFVKVDVQIVILEDLDRFENAEIFQAMRELNGLLNNSRQVKHPIRFIYAVRDSIFKSAVTPTANTPGAADTEVSLANRTKFFDVVIPMVPFVTHSNARDLLRGLLVNQDHPVSGELVDTVARRLPDMRLLQNIQNEYSIFAQRLITDRKGVEDLPADKLFAMIVYKNVYLDDFEEVLLGRGALDRLDHFRRELVQGAIAESQLKINEIENGITTQRHVREQLRQLSERLDRLVGTVLRSRPGQLSLANFEIDGVAWPADSTATYEFWRAMMNMQQQWFIVVTQYLNSGIPIAMDRGDLEVLVSGILDPKKWRPYEDSEESTNAQIQDLVDDIQFLKHADFQSLASESKFRFGFEGEAAATFSEVIDRTFTTHLAGDLVRNGYIDSFSSVYVSQYYGIRVSAAAMKFLMVNAQRDIPEFDYVLTDEDVDAILRETKGSILRERSAYNIALLDSLLESQDTEKKAAATQVLTCLIERGEVLERSFLSAFLSRGRSRFEVVGWLAAEWRLLFEYLVNDQNLSDETRTQFVVEGLHALDSNLEYAITEDVREYLLEHLYEFRTTTLPPAQGKTIQPLAAFLFRAEVICHELSRLSEPLRKAFALEARFEVTAANLKVVTQAQPISLDIIRSAAPRSLGLCLRHPQAYLAVVSTDANTAYTISDPDNFENVLEDLLKADPGLDVWDEDNLRILLSKASPSCELESLSLSSNIWPALAETRRIEKNLENVAAYLDAFGKVDRPLATLLMSEAPFVRDGADAAPTGSSGDVEGSEAQSALKLKVALPILGASKVLPDPVIRTQIVEDIDLKHWVDPSGVEPERGLLLCELIRRRICSDTAPLFERFRGTDWASIREGILVSQKFAEFMSPSLLDEHQVGNLLHDACTDERLRGLGGTVLSELAAYTPSGEAKTLLAAARFAAQTDAELGIQELFRIANATGAGGRDEVVILLARIVKTCAPDQVVDLLVQLGGGFRQLATTSTKFDVPKQAGIRPILKVLRESGHIQSYRSKPSGDAYTISRVS